MALVLHSDGLDMEEGQLKTIWLQNEKLNKLAEVTAGLLYRGNG